MFKKRISEYIDLFFRPFVAFLIVLLFLFSGITFNQNKTKEDKKRRNNNY